MKIITAVALLIIAAQSFDYATQKADRQLMDSIDCMYDQFTDPDTEDAVQALTVVCGADGYEWSLDDYDERQEVTQ